MNWQHGSRWHLQSECKRYTVSKAWVNERAVYSVWRMRSDRNLAPLCIGMFEDAQAAKACAENDAKAKERAACKSRAL